jgi:glycerol-3-phosphate dehydrogenase
VFLYPWEGATLIGTTDLDHTGDLNTEAGITQAEVDYLLEAVNDQFPSAKLTALDITATYAGVRPVVDHGSANASKAARDHVVMDEAGLVTVAGGKLTTFRLMAQDALAMAARHAGKAFVRNEDSLFTPGAALPAGWSAAVRHRLAARYGFSAQALSAGAHAADLEFIPGTQTLWLELAIAARSEAVVHLDDLLLRRTRLGILLPRGALEHEKRVRALCEPYLRWGDARWTEELTRYATLIAAHYRNPVLSPETRP